MIEKVNPSQVKSIYAEKHSVDLLGNPRVCGL